MPYNLRTFTRQALTAMLAALGFTSYLGCSDDPDLYGPLLPDDTTRIDTNMRLMYGTLTRSYSPPSDEVLMTNEDIMNDE